MKRLLLVLAAITLAFSASAATPKKKAVAKAPAKKVAVQKAVKKPAVSASVETAHRKTPYVGAISVDAATGKVLFEDHADAEAYPASVTKLMTLLLVMEDVKAGKYGFDDKVEATADAYRSEPSWVGIKVGEKMSVRDLCSALMVESANDAAIVLGVHSAGSFDAFIARMNARAVELGMAHTKYYNPNGLPPNPAKRYPWKNFNVSTARDQMILARALVTKPEVLKLTSIKTCDLVHTLAGYYVVVTRRTNEPQHDGALAVDYEKKVAQICPRKTMNVIIGYECCAGGKTLYVAKNEQLACEWCFKNGFDIYVKQMRNHNNVMVKDKLKIFNSDGGEAIDGLKTGYIDAGGSSVVLTGTRKGKRAIVVVLGSSSSNERDAQAQRLMNDALGSLAW